MDSGSRHPGHRGRTTRISSATFAGSTAGDCTSKRSSPRPRECQGRRERQVGAGSRKASGRSSRQCARSPQAPAPRRRPPRGDPGRVGVRIVPPSLPVRVVGPRPSFPFSSRFFALATEEGASERHPPRDLSSETRTFANCKSDPAKTSKRRNDLRRRGRDVPTVEDWFKPHLTMEYVRQYLKTKDPELWPAIIDYFLGELLLLRSDAEAQRVNPAKRKKEEDLMRESKKESRK